MKRALRILVSNDDGYQAPGLLWLVAALSELAVPDLPWEQ